MEKWGWPMGPALLIDVVGIDTCVHADKVLAEAYPDRMRHEGQSAIEAMLAAGRLGQKNGKGFYAWKPEKKGPPSKQSDPEAKAIVAALAKGKARGRPTRRSCERMMLPMLLETLARARGGDRRDAGRGGHGAPLRPRLPAVPRRDLPLGRRHLGLRRS